MTNRIWIELERTPGEQEIIAELASKVLLKLGFNEYVKFWWSDKKKCYCLTTGGPDGSFLELEDDGHWFNLDFAAK